jgi:glycosyltransferase involved in cell wall biosynthesis
MEPINNGAREACACLSVVIPVFNEEVTLREVVEKVLKVPHLLEVVIVDDCSTDKTADVIQDLCTKHPQLKSQRHEKNLGKTAALRTGFALTNGNLVIVHPANT